MFRILVCVKAIPNTADVRFDLEGKLQRNSGELQWNVADLAALEAALTLKTPESSITVLTMGPSKLEMPLKELLARGADEAVLITDKTLAGADTYATARALAEAVKKQGGFDLILCGKQSLDGDTGQIPGMLAAALNMACITNTENLERKNQQLVADRILEKGTQKLLLDLPCVASVQPYGYHLRLPGILGMRKARQKNVLILNAQDLGLFPEECGQAGSLTKVVKIHPMRHGHRNGPKETDLSAGTARILELLKEVT